MTISDDRLKWLAGSSSASDEVAQVARELIAAREKLLTAEAQEPVATLFKSGDSAKVIMIGAELADGYTDVYGEKPTAPPAPVAQPVPVPAEWITYYHDTDDEVFRIHSRSNKATAKRIASEIGGYVVPVYHGEPEPVAQPVQEWTNEQCLEFLSIVFRHAEIKGDLELDDIRLGVKMANNSSAAMLSAAPQPTAEHQLAAKKALLDLLHSGTASISPEPEND